MTDRETLATAYQTEHGIQATCPTTHEAYIGPIVRTARFGGREGVWLLCGVCVMHSATRTRIATLARRNTTRTCWEGHMHSCQVCHEEHATAEELVICVDGITRCKTCAYNDDYCYQCGGEDISFSSSDDDWPEWAVGMCRSCRNEAWSNYQDDMAIDTYYHEGRG